MPESLFWRSLRVKSRQKIERDRSRKFRRVAEAAFFRIERTVKLLISGLQNAGIDLAAGGRLRRLRFAQCRNDLGTLIDDVFVVLLPRRGDSFQNLSESGLTVPIFRRKISAADEWFEIGSQPDAHRPAAAAGGRLHKRHIDTIDIGPLFAIDFDVHESHDS